MRVYSVAALLLAVAVPAGDLAAAEPLPQSRDPRLVIELFAADPDIVTPTGLDVDHAGRVFMIESNTHFPPEGYAGHPSDRLLVLRDQDGDGRAEKPVVFADGFVHAMSVAVRTSLDPGRPDTVLMFAVGLPAGGLGSSVQMVMSNGFRRGASCWVSAGCELLGFVWT